MSVKHKLAIVWADGTVTGVVGEGVDYASALADAHRQVVRRTDYRSTAFRCVPESEVWQLPEELRERIKSNWEAQGGTIGQPSRLF